MAAEILYQGPLLAVILLEKASETRALARTQIAHERFVHDLFGCAEQRLIELVGHLVDAPAQNIAALLGVRLAQPAAVLQLDYLPATGRKLLLQLGRFDDRHNAVEALAVQVDDPENVAEIAGLRLDHRLPEVALVELGVAE